MGQGRRWLLLYLILCCTCDVCGIGSLALIRPFAPTDAAKLPSSFDPWDLHLPCLANLSVVVDLILCFSQDLTTDPEAANATQRIIADFHSRKAEAEAAAEDADLVGVVWTWPQCFRSISAVSALTPPEDDTYLPEGSGEAPDWVKGPNLQFLAMAEAFDDNDWGDYDVWFMMEMDCKTRRAGWLAELLEEVDARAPFAVLGSFYRGDQWDKFPMPLELRHHINGNAVYNRSNPFLQRYVATLRRAMDEGPVLQAFDVFGAALYLNSTLPPDQLGWYAGDSRVIGNYAHTPMLEVYFNGEALVHGGRLYDEWNATEQPITLVVSDFGRWDPTQPAKTELETFTESVLEGHHPFRHVVALRPQPNVTAAPRTYPLANDTLLFREVARNESGWFDWCDAPVTTPWLMYTNVFFRLPARIDLPKARTNGSVPVAFYLPSGSPHCQNAPACVFQMRRAKNFTGSEPTGHLDIGQVLIHTAQRDAFCAAWRAWHATAPGAALDPVPGPTADDYAAYLLSRGLNGLYLWENALKRGQRSYFLLRVFPTDNLGNVSSNSSGNASTNATGNASACTLLTEESACLATPRCAWRPRFEDCFHGTLAAVPQPPALNVTFADPLGCPADIAVPALRVHNGGPRSLTLETPAAPGWWLSLTPAKTGDVPPVDVSAANVMAGQVVVAQEVVVVNTAPKVLLTFLLPLLPLGNLTAAANPPQAYFKDLVSLVPGSGAVELLELAAAAAPLVLSPVVWVDGWLRSAIGGAPNLIVVNTAVAPANATRLLLALRLTGHVAAFPVHRCTTLAIPLAPDFSALPSPASVSPGITSSSASPAISSASPRAAISLPQSPSPSPNETINPGNTNGTDLLGSSSPRHSPEDSAWPSESPGFSSPSRDSPEPSPLDGFSPEPSPLVSFSPEPSSFASEIPEPSPFASFSAEPSPLTSFSPESSPLDGFSPEPSPTSESLEPSPASFSLDPGPLASFSPETSPLDGFSPETSPLASESPEPSPLPSESPETSPLASDSPEPSPLASDSPEPSPQPSDSPEESPEPSDSPEPSPRPSRSPRRSPRPSHSPQRSPRPSRSPERSPRPSWSPERSPRPSVSPERSPRPSVSPERSPRPSVSPERSPRPSASPERSPRTSASPERSARTSVSPEHSSRTSVSPEHSARVIVSPEPPRPSSIPEHSADASVLPQQSFSPVTQNATPSPSFSWSFSPSPSPSASAVSSPSPEASPSPSPVFSPSPSPLPTFIERNVSIVVTDPERIRRFGQDVVGTLTQVTAMNDTAREDMARAITETTTYRYIDADLSYLVVENGTEFNLTRPGQPFSIVATNWGPNVTRAVVTVWTLASSSFADLNVTEPAAVDALDQLLLVVIDRMDDAGNLLNSAPMDIIILTNETLRLGGLYFTPSLAAGLSLKAEGATLERLPSAYRITLPHTSAVNVFTSAGNSPYAFDAFDNNTTPGVFPTKAAGSDLALLGLLALPLSAVAAAAALWVWYQKRSQPEERSLQFTKAVADTGRRHYNTPDPAAAEPVDDNDDDEDDDAASQSEDDEAMRKRLDANTPYATPVDWTLRKYTFGSVASLDLDGFSDVDVCAVVAAATPRTEPQSDGGPWPADGAERRDSRISIDELEEPSSSSVSSRRPSADDQMGVRRDSRISIDPALCISDNSLSVPRPGFTSPMSSSRRGSSPAVAVSSMPERSPKLNPLRPGLLHRLRPQPRSSLPTLHAEGEPSSIVTAGFAAPTSSPLPEPAE